MARFLWDGALIVFMKGLWSHSVHTGDDFGDALSFMRTKSWWGEGIIYLSLFQLLCHEFEGKWKLSCSVITVFFFDCPLILSLGSITSRNPENYRKSGSVFLFEKHLAVSLLFLKKIIFSPFFLSYILYAMKCTNLKWTVVRIFAYMYPHAMTSHIKIEICLWLWWFPSSPSQSILSPPGSQHCDSYQIFGGLFAIMCAFSSDSWWSKLV